MFRTHLFIAQSTDRPLSELDAYLKEETDYLLFRKNSSTVVKKYLPSLDNSWNLFLDEESKRCQSWSNSERLLFIKAVYLCLNNIKEERDFAQLIRSALDLKKYNGVRYFFMLFQANIPQEQRHLKEYTHVCRLLVELREQPGLADLLKTYLPNLVTLHQQLEIKYDQYRQSKFPKRGIDELISIFSTKNELVSFPLSVEELKLLKPQLERVNLEAESASKLSLSELKQQAQRLGLQYKQSNDLQLRCQLVALVCEAVYRTYKIKPHDTQVLSILALLNSPENLKGRIAQIKAGEGKSTIIAILAAISALKGDFVDIVTSADYLAIRDAKKYKPFYEELGLTSSHICGEHVTKTQFQGQILYGTNTDYEFAYLRDGLYQAGLRYSYRNGELQPRTFDTVIVDEVDNLFLDTALNSALMSVQSNETIAWIYKPIFNKVKENSKINPDQLHAYLLDYEQGKYRELVSTISKKRLKDWIESANDAIHTKVHGVDYLVKATRTPNSNSKETVDDIVINDYENTGRFQEGSQWGNGLHQFLQIKHNLQPKAETITAASLSHPTYFGMYRHILALTGTMGEAVEREEIKHIYKVDCFDVPPHFPCQRVTLKPQLCLDKKTQYEAILKSALAMQQQKRPCLIVFKTINESNEFSQFMKSRNIEHQLLNATQRESEDYVVARAGDAGVITVATNTAGRGTDIELSPESKEAGGLHQIFAFYPANLRVEVQGESRAARQGQPGSCEMILSYEDDHIKSLIQMMTIVNYVLTLNSSNLISLDKFIQFDAPSEEKIKALGMVRTKKIEQESVRRSQGALKEEIYFEKLQLFFKQLTAVTTLFESTEFKNVFLKNCQTWTSGTDLNSSSLGLSKEWESGCLLAKKLLARQNKGETVDWTPFYDSVKRTYINQIRLHWAVFYNKLHNEVVGSDIKEVKQQVDSLFQQAQPKLNEYLPLDIGSPYNLSVEKQNSNGPMELVLKWGSRMLINAQKELNVSSNSVEQSLINLSLFEKTGAVTTSEKNSSLEIGNN